jgi:hypothetical protein
MTQEEKNKLAYSELFEDANVIEWWGIKVRKSDGSFHYVSDIPTDVAGVVEEFLDEIDDDNLEEEQ